MVAACRERGLTADTADALGFLDAQPDASLGGVIAIQVVEHLEPPVLVRFIETAFLKMRPGAPLVLETINAACWMAFFETYMRDLTHARPLHPDTLRFLVQAAGFRHVDVRFRAPVSDADRLPTVAPLGNPALAPLADAINAHADKLNARLFSSMDYAVVARR
jgi:O-antigen chain-terminating methyltransferase